MAFVSTPMYISNTISDDNQLIDLTHFVIEGDETECCIVEIVNSEQPFLEQEHPLTLIYQQLPESQPAIVVQQPSIVEPKDVTEQVLCISVKSVDETINNDNGDDDDMQEEGKLVIVEEIINDDNISSCIITTVGETVTSIVDAVNKINNENSDLNSVVNETPVVLEQPEPQVIVKNQRPVRERKAKHHHNCLDCEQCKPANVEEVLKKKEEPKNVVKKKEEPKKIVEKKDVPSSKGHIGEINLETQMLIVQDLDAMKLTRSEIESKYKIPNFILNYIILHRNNIIEDHKNQYVNMLDLTPRSNSPNTSTKKDLSVQRTTKTDTKNTKTTSKLKSKSNVFKSKISNAKLNVHMKKKCTKFVDKKVTKLGTKTNNNKTTSENLNSDLELITQNVRQSLKIVPQKNKISLKNSSKFKEISKQNITKLVTENKKTTDKMLKETLQSENKIKNKKSNIKNKLETAVEKKKKEKLKNKVEVRQSRTSGRVSKKRTWSSEYETAEVSPMVVKMFNYNKKETNSEITKKKKGHFTRKCVNLSTKMLIIDEVDSGLLTRKEISIKYNIPFPTLSTIMNHRDKVEQCFKLDSKVTNISIDLNTKLKILAEIDNGIKSKSQIAKQFNINNATLSTIIKCKDKIQNTAKNCMSQEKVINTNNDEKQTQSNKKDSIDLYTKIEILKQVDKKVDKKIIAQTFNINNNTILNIIKHRDKIVSFCKSQNIANNKYRSSTTFEVENRLLEYWLNYDGVITNTQLCVQAVKFAQELKIQNFKCHPSCAWIWRFKKRFNIKTKRTSSEDLVRLHKALQKHKKEKSSGKFMCDICKCELKSASLMEKHVRLHHFPTSF